MINRKIPESIKMPSTIVLAEEAVSRGIRLKHLNPYQEENSFVEFKYGKHSEHIFGSRSSRLSASANYIITNKALTKDFLEKNKISSTEGKMFLSGDISAIGRFAKEIGYPIVLKKYDGAHGSLVFLDVGDFQKVSFVLEKYFRREKYVLVEKKFVGKEYRFIATAEKVLAVAFRDPANVVGDGIHTIRDLVAIKNTDSRRGDNYTKPLVTIKIDDHVKAKLKSQDLALSTVPARGKKIYLRNNSNISTGGDSIDVTDSIHPQLKKIAIKAIKSIPGLPYAGIDIMIKGDISSKPSESSYAILEMNSSPGIFIHHFPYSGKAHNVAGGILDVLFPETKK